MSQNLTQVFQNSSSIIAITNDGPKGPPCIAKEGSYKIAKRANAQIISIFGGSTKFWANLKPEEKLLHVFLVLKATEIQINI